MRVYFLRRNFLNTVVILKEGNTPHPQCPQCEILVPWPTLDRRNTATTQCARGAE